MAVVPGNSTGCLAPDIDSTMEERDSNALLSAIGGHRDEAAFAELCERYRRQAFSMAFRILRNRSLAEDAVQEAMLAVWVSAASYDVERGNARNWILGIVMKKSISLKQNQVQRTKREERIRMERGTLDETAVEPESRELIALLRKKIDDLPELECTLLACYYGAGMSQQKIAELTAVPPRSVSMKLQQTLDRLLSELSKAGFAAALPLLSSENLYEALTTGLDCPPGMLDRMLAQIRNPATKAPSRSVRPVPRKVHPKLWVAAGLALAAAGTGIWIATSRPAVSPAQATADAATAAPVLNRVWTFETNVSGLRPAAGEWYWRPGDGRRPGAIRIPGETAILLPLKVPHQTFLVRIQATWTVGENTQADSGLVANWSDGERVPGQTVWKLPMTVNYDRIHPTVDMTVDYVFSGHYGLCYNKGICTAVNKFSGDDAYEKILLVIKNCSIEKIEIRALKPGEYTDAVQDPESLITTLKDHGKVITADEPSTVLIVPKAP